MRHTGSHLAGPVSSHPEHKKRELVVKRTYVLVHGAWHGAWCWKKVLPLLRQRGHRAVALDLAGHGEDHTPVAGITLETYVDQILSCVHKEAHGEPVTLVGHSFGGLVITQAAEQS